MSQNYENLSVFGLERRTNNACESYHARFNHLVTKKPPGAYQFADYANEMLENYHDDLERLKEDPYRPIGKRIGWTPIHIADMNGHLGCNTHQ